jgi:hypothetical protein
LAVDKIAQHLQRRIDDIQLLEILDLVAGSVGEAGERRKRRANAGDQVGLHIAQALGRLNVITRRSHLDQPERDIIELQAFQGANLAADAQAERSQVQPDTPTP